MQLFSPLLENSSEAGFISFYHPPLHSLKNKVLYNVFLVYKETAKMLTGN